MRIGGSLLLIAIGAILRFAITPQYSHGVNWGTIGVILMIVGAIGALITIAFLTARRRTDVTVRNTGPTYAAPAQPTYAAPGETRSVSYVEPAPTDPRV